MTGTEVARVTDRLTVISYGGGVQSTALVVLAATGRLRDELGLDVQAALFSNVGDDSEHPDTVRYVEEVATPWAAERGFPVHTLHRTRSDGRRETLFQRLTEDTKNGRVRDTIPLRGQNGMPMGRACTRDFKIAVVGKWLKAHGASGDNPATVCIGISTDEIERVSNKRAEAYERPIYPLIDLGLDRAACMGVIRRAGLPVPPKSACWFCPFGRPQKWAEMRRDEPELFDRAVQLERQMNDRRAAIGREPLYLTRFAKPLDEAILTAQDELPLTSPDIATCDDGYCWT